MSKSLLFTQILRLLKSNHEKSIGHLGFWLGELLGDFLPGLDIGFHCQEPGEYFGSLADIVAEVKMTGFVSAANWRSVLNRNIYSCLCLDFLPPKIVSFQHSWKNLKHDCLISPARELLFLLVHNKLLVKERLFRIRQAVDPYCSLCLDQVGAVECDVKHYFCSCPRIVKFWVRLKRVVTSLLEIDGSTDDDSILKLNLSVKRCPGVIWIMGAYVSVVWSSKDDRSISDAEFFGFLKFKFKTDKLGTSEQFEKIKDIVG